MTTILKLPYSLLSQLFYQAQSVPTKEICGLIGKDQAHQFFCYPVTNIATQPSCQFEMSPQQQIAVLREMRVQKQNFFAIYHSHPSSEAFPSQRDTQLAYYPNSFYLIISLSTKGLLQLRGFRLQQAVFQEVHLEIGS